MDVGILRGIGTIILFLSYVGLWLWAWAPAQRARFDEAASLPFLGDDTSPKVPERGLR